MHEGHAVVKLPPILDDDAARRSSEPFRRLARDNAVRWLTVDATATRDISARGLGLLVAVSRIAQSRGVRVTFETHDDRLVQLFEAAQLEMGGRHLVAVTDCDGVGESAAAARASCEGRAG